MSAPQETKVIVNKALLCGRVNAVRKSDDTVYTEVILPSVDEYSQPATIEVRSKKRLGQIGETVQINVSCAGYRGKPFSYQDKETGERFTRRPVVNSYLAIED
ncbi:hypothetical protein R6242_03570 [Iodobacter sp. CM08]|uniref:hypothetical protein n=1 Tax=Iodobacter sp. CM08 TaxID=3085902 RepID=UPI00298142DD|nr:hypothetical protein [Iodobacter sp. CM08]MDW5415648.1 hypothetical protein [Iodobacter sp. CM08]